ncbi:MAG: transposase [Myxococcota bacterium]
MPRPPRFDFPGARHHVMNRGARRQPVFGSDVARLLFLSALAELPPRFGLHVHGWALMPNHFHLLLETPRGNLSRAMRHLGARFTQRLNAKHGWDGPVFRGRFHNRVVEKDDYWTHLLLYVHANPVRGGLATRIDDTDWSSHAAYAGLASTPEWLTTEDLLAAHGGRDAYRQHVWEYTVGRRPDPAGFEEGALWSSPVSVDLEAVWATPAPPMTPEVALAVLERVTGASSASLREGKRGRGGNPARQLAAWWLAYAAGLPHREVARHLRTSVALVSRWMKVRGESRSPQFDGWVRALEDELHPPPK